MTSALEKLLAPISAESECGEDISYDPAYQEVEKLILGKPETQFGPGEPPNWHEVRERCIPLLARSKHLRVFVMLTAALARVEGLPGFRDGISLLKESVEKYWPNLYPRLDPEDNSDPTERINIIASLTAPLATAGDPFNFLEALRGCPLSDSAKYGRFSLQDIANSRAGVKPTPTMRVPGAKDIEAAFRDTDPAKIQALEAASAEALAVAKGLEHLLDNLVGPGKARDFSPLLTTLGEIRKQLALYLPAAVSGGDAPGAQQGLAQASAEPTRADLAASVESREQVVKALDLICNYYSRYEPSSPVPLLLQRARRLVELDFLGIVADLSPETLEKVRAAAGVPKASAET